MVQGLGEVEGGGSRTRVPAATVRSAVGVPLSPATVRSAVGVPLSPATARSAVGVPLSPATVPSAVGVPLSPKSFQPQSHPPAPSQQATGPCGTIGGLGVRGGDGPVADVHRHRGQR